MKDFRSMRFVWFRKESSNVIFDCVKPAGFKISDSEITSYLQKRVTEWNPRYRCVIKVEQSYV